MLSESRIADERLKEMLQGYQDIGYDDTAAALRELLALREESKSSPDMWWDAYDPERPQDSAREIIVNRYNENRVVEFQCAIRLPNKFGYITYATEAAEQDAKLFDTLAEAEAALKAEAPFAPPTEDTDGELPAPPVEG